MATDRPGPSIRISDILRSGLALIIILGVLGFLAGLALGVALEGVVDRDDADPRQPARRQSLLPEHSRRAADQPRERGTGRALLRCRQEGRGQGGRGSQRRRPPRRMSPSRCRSTRRSSRSRTRTPIRPRRRRCHRHSPTRTSSSASDRAQQQITEQSAQLQAQIDTNQTELESLATQLAVTPPNSAQATILQQAIQGVSSRITTMSVRQSELTGTPLDPGQVVVPAKLEAKGSINTKLLLPVAGLIGGALAGFVIATLRAQANPEDLASGGPRRARGQGAGHVVAGRPRARLPMRSTSKRCAASASHSSPSSEVPAVLDPVHPGRVVEPPRRGRARARSCALDHGIADDRGRRDQQRGSGRANRAMGPTSGSARSCPATCR